MSYTALIEFRNGLPCESHEFANSWLGSAYVWSSLFDRYLKRERFDSWLSDSERLWPLAKDALVPEYARLVMAFTFDKALLLRKDFHHFAKCLRQFVEEYPPGGRWEPHLVKWADLIESSDAQAFGLYGTSVSENLWNPYDEEKDDHVLYNIDTGTDHFDVYEYVLGVDDEEEAATKTEWSVETNHTATGRIGPFFVQIVGGTFVSFRWFASIDAEGIDIDGHATVITARSEEDEACLYNTMEEAMEDAEQRLSTLLSHLATAKEVAI